MLYRVLIVEDHPFQLQHLAQLFRSVGGFDVELQGNASMAIESLRNQAYHLVVTDLMMPQLDGVQFIQKMSLLPTPPALGLMTAASTRMLGGVAKVAENLDMRVAGMISKPLQIHHVLALRHYLDRGRTQANRQPVACPGVHSARVLTHALQSGEIQAWFQPKKSLLDGRIVGAEALARWLHPVEGILMPRAFLAELESAGLDLQLLYSMLEQTLAVQALWAAQGHRLPVSINLPTHLLDQPDLVDTLHRAVRARGADPKTITFELTETSTTRHSSDYLAGTCRLRLMGFGLAQDDFGKGYSSYSNLITTPFTEMKIDRSLVNGCAKSPDMAIALASAAELGRALGMVTVAEGVETREDLEVVRKARCNQVQGFIISPAVDGTRMPALLNGHSYE
ncbi:EAL domain-containing response regulator [Pseudomonas sp. Marseille-P9655]|uniref:EAL domain-containing response regulator n=1 Tax=Pseudomonas sp. Marseille-P9655 TaxID=2866591 RepID=UPI00298F1670|nr:EAL domain-containing response regulator [Pseudomonas sp. Marseille-P9655]